MITFSVRPDWTCPALGPIESPGPAIWCHQIREFWGKNIRNNIWQAFHEKQIFRRIGTQSHQKIQQNPNSWTCVIRSVTPFKISSAKSLPFPESSVSDLSEVDHQGFHQGILMFPGTPPWCDLGRKHNMTCHFCSLSVSHLFMISPRGPPLPVDSEAGRNLPQVFEEMHLLNLIGFFWRVKPHPKTSPSKLKIHWRTWWEHRHCFAGFLRNVLDWPSFWRLSSCPSLSTAMQVCLDALCCSQSLHGSRLFRPSQMVRVPKWSEKNLPTKIDEIATEKPIPSVISHASGAGSAHSPATVKPLRSWSTLKGTGEKRVCVKPLGTDILMRSFWGWNCHDQNTTLDKWQ